MKPMASDMATGGGSAETSPLLGRSVAGSEYGGIGSCEADGGAGAGLRRAGRADYGRMFLHNGSTNVRSQFKTFAGLKSSLSSGFYALAYMPSGKCLTTMVGIYVCIIFFYGVIWTAIGVICPECNLEIHNLLEGCLFSLESLATIGYGTQSGDIFFGDCFSAALTLLLEICTKLFVDSMVIGIIYIKLARPSLRVSSFLVSDVAVLRRINGDLYLMCQFVDTRAEQLLSSTLRLFSLHKDIGADKTASPFRYSQLKVTYPEYDYVPMLMFLPQLIVHRIDESSPLMPPKVYADAYATRSVDPIEVDIEDGLTCNQRLENRIVDAYLTDMDFEIFGLVDGSDSLSGMPTQLRFSYRQLNNELKWNQAFVSCVSTDPDSGAPLIDYDSFQKMIPCRGNVEFDDSRRPPSIFESMA